MARMYSGKRGKAGSKKPETNTIKTWLTYTPVEVEQLVVKLAKTGKSSAVVGLILRDSYGIPSVKTLTKKSVYQIIKEHKLSHEIPEVLLSLIKKEIILSKHLDKNKHDMPSKRGLLLTQSRIRRLTKYYIRTKVLPIKWVYSKEQIKFA